MDRPPPLTHISTTTPPRFPEGVDIYKRSTPDVEQVIAECLPSYSITTAREIADRLAQFGVTSKPLLAITTRYDIERIFSVYHNDTITAALT